jgi:hypothetical protein
MDTIQFAFLPVLYGLETSFPTTSSVSNTETRLLTNNQCDDVENEGVL